MLFKADTAAEFGNTAALAGFPAVGTDFFLLRFQPLSLQKFLGNAAVDEIPGEKLVQGAFPCGIEIHGQTAFRKGVQPLLIVVVFTPCIVDSALLINLQDDLTEPSVAPCQHPFQNGSVRFVPVVLDALLVELLHDRQSCYIGFV